MKGKPIPAAILNDPVLGRYLEDFFLLMACPSAFAYDKMSLRWQSAMRLLSMHWEVQKALNSRCGFAGGS